MIHLAVPAHGIVHHHLGITTARREYPVILLRHELGDELRELRRAQGRTLREVSTSARVSLGYLSEVERGEKEASSELLSSICRALAVPLSEVLGSVSERVARSEAMTEPVQLPVRETTVTTVDEVVPAA